MDHLKIATTETPCLAASSRMELFGQRSRMLALASGESFHASAQTSRSLATNLAQIGACRSRSSGLSYS